MPKKRKKLTPLQQIRRKEREARRAAHLLQAAQHKAAASNLEAKGKPLEALQWRQAQYLEEAAAAKIRVNRRPTKKKETGPPNPMTAVVKAFS